MVGTKIYLTCTAPLADERLYAALYAAVSEERRKKTDRYRFAKDRRLSLGAEGLLLYALREDGRGTRLSCAYGENGKPRLLGEDGFSFNLSHSGEYAMLAVSDAELGCDIEQIRDADPRLIRYVLTPEELADLKAVDETARSAQFFRYWVLKESCMKAVGRGLSLAPQRIAVRLAPQPEAECDALPSPFSLWEGELPGYRLAVCRLGEDAAVRLRVVPVEEIVAGTMKI